VHCMGGRGRTGTVIGVALVMLGHDADDTVAYLDRVARARGRRGWPESPWQANVVRGAR
jgi:protein-tyrosine phosphatase